MKHVIGIDPSLSATAVIVLDESGECVHKVTFKSDPASGVLGRVIRYVGVSAQLEDLLEKYEPEICCIEGYSMGSNMAGHSSIIEHGYEIRRRLALFSPDISIYEIPPTTLKKHATGKGNADKSAVVAKMARLFPELEFKTNDETDAAALAMFALQIAGYAGPENDAQRGSLAAVIGPKEPKVKKKRKEAAF